MKKGVKEDSGGRLLKKKNLLVMHPIKGLKGKANKLMVKNQLQKKNQSIVFKNQKIKSKVQPLNKLNQPTNQLIATDRGMSNNNQVQKQNRQNL